jgi:hypothetical protein
LRQIEGAGAPLQQRPTSQEQRGADGINDRENDGALQQPVLLDLVSGKRIGRDAYLLKEDE